MLSLINLHRVKYLIEALFVRFQLQRISIEQGTGLGKIGNNSKGIKRFIFSSSELKNDSSHILAGWSNFKYIDAIPYKFA